MDDADATTRAAIERELSLVRGAMRMVSMGSSRALTVGGLRFGEEILVVLLPEADNAGIVIDALWTADERGCDLRVHRAEAGDAA